MKAYKLVQFDYIVGSVPRYTSIVMCDDSRFCVQYFTDKFTEAPDRSKLFVFKDVPTERQLNMIVAELDNQRRLFECEVDELTLAEFMCDGGDEAITQFWNNNQIAPYRIPVIKGTFYCNKVKLVKDVTDDYVAGKLKNEG